MDPGHWKHVVHSRDLQTLQISYSYKGMTKEIHIQNVYNEKGSDTLHQLRGASGVRTRRQGEQRIEHVIVGDVNLHHPAWGGDKAQRDEEAEDLIELTDNTQMELWMEPGTITWKTVRNRPLT
jgi:Endonuclease-reverse transcriptase